MLRRNRKSKFLLAAAALAALALAGAAAAASLGSYTKKGAWSFVSAPNLHPPKLHTAKPTKGKLSRGYFITDNFYNVGKPPMVGQGGPLILDRNLQPVWVDPVGTKLASGNLRVQSYNGQPVLTWWQGVINAVGITSSGEDVVVDQHYRTVATLKGADGWVLSEHDFVISGQDAWVTAYKNVPENLAPYGGSAHGTLYDAAVQEYSLKTGQLLYNWDAVQHVPLSESEMPVVKGQAWDAYHLNTIQLQPGGATFLTSFRNTWAAYLVNIATGGIEWTLGGKASSFKFGNNAKFHWQHDVQLHPGNVVSMFDDACCAFVHGKFGARSGPSRGLVLRLDLTKHTATRVAQYIVTTAEYVRPKKFNAPFNGSTQLLGGGNVLVAFGSSAFFLEFSKSGKALLQAVWPGPDFSYRVYLQNWVGEPLSPPSGAIRKSKSSTTVYASWNGATQVTSWRVLAGQSSKHLHAVAHRGRGGFETAIAIKGSYSVFEVQALSSNGHVLGTSKAFSAATKGKSKPSSPGFY